MSGSPIPMADLAGMQAWAGGCGGGGLMPRLAAFIGHAGVLLGIFALAAMLLGALPYLTLPGIGQ